MRGLLSRSFMVALSGAFGRRWVSDEYAVSACSAFLVVTASMIGSEVDPDEGR
ncbi:hypothetical protein ACFWN2_18885 [Lentzea sp. NPDC058436]|uniref:hypothetical protein n=1 Tax=Lentzea sp. NPDC058436 TaxID=3346499 RepID=UPI003654F516